MDPSTPMDYPWPYRVAEYVQYGPHYYNVQPSKTRDFEGELAADPIPEYQILHPITHSHLLSTPPMVFVPTNNHLVPISDHYYTNPGEHQDFRFVNNTVYHYLEVKREPSPNEQSFNAMEEQIIDSASVGQEETNNNHEQISTLPGTDVDTTQANQDPFKCVVCSRTFTGQCYLTQHNNAKHAGFKRLKCRCGKYYSDEAKYQNHKLKHDVVDKPFKCKLCPSSYHHKTDLRTHSYVHSERKPHVCPVCSKQFARRDHRDKHVNTHKKKVKLCVE